MLINYYYKYKIVKEKLKYLALYFRAGFPDLRRHSAMFKSISALVFSSLCMVQAAASQSGFSNDYFRSPLDIEMFLSGNFGELRSNHFHAGIDIKTRGVVGHNVYASAGGYISRIKIEAAGYGNTLYITHPDGYTTVYAHLDRFREDIAGWVREQQYSRQQHALNIFPEKGEWVVEKGEMIAYSGTSGYSFGPHLHFEIRDASNQEPMNALRFGFDIEDLVAPKIFSLYVYRWSGNSMNPHESAKTRLETGTDSNSYFLVQGDTIDLNGMAGFGIEAFDYLNGAHNRCGIYRIRMLVDEEMKYEWKMDRFSFSESRYINSYIDYGEKFRSRKLVQKTFVEPNNRLKLYQYVENHGMIDFSEPGCSRVRFILEDVNGNASELNFTVQGGSPRPLAANVTISGKGKGPANRSVTEFREEYSCMQDNMFSQDGIMLSIPAGALYTDLHFRYRREKAPEGSYSAIHVIHDHYTPVHLACSIAIRPDTMPDELKSKALICYIDDEDEISAAGGEWSEGMLRTQILEFGRYLVMVDTTVPMIRSLDLEDTDEPVSSESLRFRVRDETSGIKSYEGYIDNEWVLFEYDAKNDLVFYSFDPERLESGREHELELYITDNKENIAYYYATFYW
jgi:hypothetical protein